jgi:hypothetical protein
MFRMFWNFLLVLAASIGLLKLGALSVWVSVLNIVLLAVLALALLAGLLFVWKHFSKT